ncbi:hypothetical protein JKP88DRAFT_249611 [Tribonema minus]|uniref:Uncharacterized protein n=1 Tax=Tribonema minus TaxID=303371 RepID=A0A835YIY3_9STRA|nr:hypothetical protein JKP88DRAFT_249611 [Tribonema minus]
MALMLYGIAAECGDAEVAGKGQSEYIATRLNPVSGVDTAGVHIHTCYCDLMLSTARKLRAEMPCQRRPRSQTRQPPAKDMPAVPAPPVEQGTRTLEAPIAQARVVQRVVWRASPAARPATRIVDTQNVHDHSVVAASKTNVAQMIKKHGDLELTPDVLLEVRNLAAGNTNALAILTNLSNAKHTTLGVSEKQALAHVWRTISDKTDETLQTNMKETLTQRLGECIEHDLPVCSTGRFVRILATLDGVYDDAVKPLRPMWAVRDEVATLAGQVREDVLANASPADAEAYDNGTSEKLSSKMRQELTLRAVGVYVDELDMNAGVLQGVLAPYMNAM